jgi:hypothetical protein
MIIYIKLRIPFTFVKKNIDDSLGDKCVGILQYYIGK